MKRCPTCGKTYDDSFGVCVSCPGTVKLEVFSEEITEALKAFIATNTDTIEGKKIKEYVGIVNGICITGFGAFREFMSGFTDAFGGKSGSYQKEYHKAKDFAIEELKKEAVSLSANAVVCVRLSFQNISAKGKSLVLVAATGTAVITE